MKIICSRNLLNDAISMAQKAISSRSALPILDGLLLEAEETLTLTGYDMETGIECRVETDIIEPGSIVVNARMFGDIIRKMPEDIVTIETDEDLFITIQCANSNFKIRGLEAGDYPKIPIVEQAQQLSVPQRVFKDMITQTVFAVSTDENRPILNGVKVTAHEHTLDLVAIDGFRLALRREEFAEKLPDMSFIVPSKAMQEAARIMNPTDKPVKVYLSHNHILFDTGTIKLVSRLLQGEYMQYNSIIPNSSMSRLELTTKDMLDAIERASLVINVDQRRFPVTIHNPDHETLVISAKTDIGNVREEINCQLSGENIDADYNPKYFVDALRNLPSEKISLEFSGTFGPCVIKPLTGEQFLYLVLPLRR